MRLGTGKTDGTPPAASPAGTESQKPHHPEPTIEEGRTTDAETKNRSRPAPKAMPITTSSAQTAVRIYDTPNTRPVKGHKEEAESRTAAEGNRKEIEGTPPPVCQVKTGRIETEGTPPPAFPARIANRPGEGKIEIGGIRQAAFRAGIDRIQKEKEGRTETGGIPLRVFPAGMSRKQRKDRTGIEGIPQAAFPAEIAMSPKAREAIIGTDAILRAAYQVKTNKMQGLIERIELIEGIRGIGETQLRVSPAGIETIPKRGNKPQTEDRIDSIEIKLIEIIITGET